MPICKSDAFAKSCRVNAHRAAWTAVLTMAALTFFVADVSGQNSSDPPAQQNSGQQNPGASPQANSQQNSSPPQPSPSPDGASPQESGSEPAQEDQNGGFVFKKEIEEVVLHAVVVDDQNRLVTNLTEKDFRIFEDGKQQNLTFFRKEHVPVSLGILVDNSGSMLPKRAKLSEAALQLVQGSQQKDEVFVVNFGEDAYLDQDYTDDVTKLRAALMRTGTRGSTALYDAIIASTDHLNSSPTQQKKVLLLVTDGRDNASQATFQEVLRKLQTKAGPVLYSIVLSQEGQRDDRDRQVLQTLSQQTGGTAFFPGNLDEVQSIAKGIAENIRSQYVIGYRSANPQTAGKYHAIQVQATGTQSALRVSTRAGYYSGELGANK